jgi:acyl-CoA synthetase (AMP-forming)/AMP-acid ligase II
MTHATFWGLVETAAAGAPDRVVVADDHGRSLTSVQLRDAAERVAAGLGVAPGSVVSWQVPTTLEAVVVLVALARLGAIQNPVIPILRRREVGLITTQVGTQLLIVPDVWRGFEHGAMGREIGGFDVLALDLDGEVGPELRLPMGDPATLPEPPVDDGDGRWVYFSSGTTADPKGARHTDSSLMASATAMEQHLGFGEGDVYPIAFPISHIGGIAMLTAALRSGGTLVLFDTFDPATTGERMAAHRPTILGSAVPFFRVYLDAQRRHGDEPLFPDLRTCTAGGAPTPPEIVKELVEAFGVRGVVQSWGLTEFPIATAARPDDPPEVLAGTIGKPGPGVELRVVDGELRLKGLQCFLGYLDPSLDTHAFDEEGWFRTGDLGHVDDDGNVHITGRLKDVIIRNAENISALEIEDVLLRHPGVADVAVLGMPDPRTGERVVAVVVPEPGATVTLEVLAEHCAAEGLARHKTPERLELVPDLPRNPMGKILKQQLKDTLSA